jgi:hypothetical protein
VALLPGFFLGSEFDGLASLDKKRTARLRELRKRLKEREGQGRNGVVTVFVHCKIGVSGGYAD